MFEKYKKPVKITPEGLIFSSSIKWNRKGICNNERINGCKIRPHKRKLYQTIGVINLNKIKNWSKIKKTSQWVNINFQTQGNNRDTEHFSHNFITKNTGDVLDVTLKLIDDGNEEIKFEEKEKNFQSLNFCLKF